MRTLISLFALVLPLTTFASAIEMPQVPGNDNPTLIVYTKNEGGRVSVDSATPGSGAVGATIDEAEVTRIVDILTRIGVKPSVKGVPGTKTTVYEIADLLCYEGDREVANPCKAGKKKLRLGVELSRQLINVLDDYQGVHFDFEHEAEFGMKKISCKITEVPSIKGLYRQCNFFY